MPDGDEGLRKTEEALSKNPSLGEELAHFLCIEQANLLAALYALFVRGLCEPAPQCPPADNRRSDGLRNKLYERS